MWSIPQHDLGRESADNACHNGKLDPHVWTEQHANCEGIFFKDGKEILSTLFSFLAVPSVGLTHPSICGSSFVNKDSPEEVWWRTKDQTANPLFKQSPVTCKYTQETLQSYFPITHFSFRVWPHMRLMQSRIHRNNLFSLFLEAQQERHYIWDTFTTLLL